jgi:MAF protein
MKNTKLPLLIQMPSSDDSMFNSDPPIILASSSQYRQKLLRQLGLPFRCLSPDIDESPHPGETPGHLANRLALTKAKVISKLNPTALVIGSDQVCSLGSIFFTKPISKENACAQLQACSGRQVDFYTGIALVQESTGFEKSSDELFSVQFRNLTQEEIENYVARELPLDCAGSFKVEGLGISLFEQIIGTDYNALIGLPLIKLCEFLRQAGVNPLTQARALQAHDHPQGV